MTIPELNNLIKSWGISSKLYRMFGKKSFIDFKPTITIGFSMGANPSCCRISLKQPNLEHLKEVLLIWQYQYNENKNNN